MAEKTPPKKRGRRPKLDPELVAAALAEMQGNVAAVAKRFGVDRTSVRDLIGRRPALTRVCQDAREGMLDHAESALYRAVVAGEAWAVCFFLKTQGRGRGYVEKPAAADPAAAARTGDTVELATRVLAAVGARLAVPGGGGGPPGGDPLGPEPGAPGGGPAQPG